MASRKQSTRRRNNEKNNMQDAFADREYNKGYRSGKQSKKKNATAKSGVYPVDTKSSDNDVSWYFSSNRLLTDVGSYSFNTASGLLVEESYQSKPPTGWTTSSTTSQRFPGVMAYSFVPSIGGSNSKNDPINIAAISNYSYVRHANSGSKNYEPNDLMIYYLAMDSLYTFYSWMVRIYGTMSSYSYTNRYTPDALIQAMHVNPSSIRSNLAQFRAYINNFARRLAQLAVPTEITYVTRHVWMTENIYVDGETSKAQYYMYTPAGFYKYTEGTESSPAGSLYLMVLGAQYAGNLWTMQNIMDLGDDLIEAVVSSEDCGIISGDIMKAYGSNLFRVAEIAETYTVTPVYNREVLSQMENGTYFASPISIGTITQNVEINNSYLVESLVIDSGINTSWINTNSPQIYLSMMRSDLLINMHMESVTPADFVVATRNIVPTVDPNRTAAIVNGSNTTIGVYPYGQGSEVFLSADMYYFDDPGSGQPPELTKMSAPTILPYKLPENVLPGNIAALIERESLLASFDWHHRCRPFLFKIPTTGLSQIIPVEAPFDIDNYAIVNYRDIKRMNSIILLNMFIANAGQFSPK